MRFEWDAAKAEANFAKHGISFADAVEVFEDASAVTRQDDSAAEERFVTIGLDAFARFLVVVYTWRNNRIRLISARRATRAERRHYAQGRR
jgi:hypothetical protein